MFTKMNLSVNVEGIFELNHCILCLYGLLKGCSSGMTEYINLEFSGNDKGDDQLTKKAILHTNTTTTTATSTSTRSMITATTIITTTNTSVASTTKTADTEKKYLRKTLREKWN